MTVEQLCLYARMIRLGYWPSKARALALGVRRMTPAVRRELGLG